ncbi:phage tail protein [Actinotalea subterranea]|uniref:phage tail protein n=1 Tax=Actinotalea subterranea TaxID=2607497 RepID=UPI0011EE9C08|nr:tail fiber protein [Actinotalea subterranea]
MADPFVGEIRMGAWTFAPTGWAFCDGQLMPISQNTALFVLLGTSYGGDGITTFALPDLRGASPVHAGQGPGLSPYGLGERGGVEEVTLLESQIPAHDHGVRAGTRGTTGNPSAAVWAQAQQGRSREQLYSTGPVSGAMAPGAIAPAGGSVPHNNRPPSLSLTFVIALVGVFPPRP